MITDIVNVRWLGKQDYVSCWQAMQHYTQQRDATSRDEIWLLEHDPVFTQGQNGKAEHVLNPGAIPVIQSDRGGQITYHGPGQLMIYTLIDLKRKKLNVRELVCCIERSVIDLLAAHGRHAYAKSAAPGVYIDQKKICSLGLRIRRGCSYHGIALNVAMDLEPFNRIHPCGYSELQMTQLADVTDLNSTSLAGHELTTYLMKNLGYTTQHVIEGLELNNGN